MGYLVFAYLGTLFKCGIDFVGKTGQLQIKTNLQMSFSFTTARIERYTVQRGNKLL